MTCTSETFEFEVVKRTFETFEFGDFVVVDNPSSPHHGKKGFITSFKGSDCHKVYLKDGFWIIFTDDLVLLVGKDEDCHIAEGEKVENQETKERITLQVHIDTSEKAYLQYVREEITKQQYMEAVQESHKRADETGSPYEVREVPIELYEED